MTYGKFEILCSPDLSFKITGNSKPHAFGINLRAVRTQRIVTRIEEVINNHSRGHPPGIIRAILPPLDPRRVGRLDSGLEHRTMQCENALAMKRHVVVKLGWLPRLATGIFIEIPRFVKCLPGHLVRADVIWMRVPTVFVVGRHHVRSELPDERHERSRDLLQGQISEGARRKWLDLAAIEVRGIPRVLEPEPAVIYPERLRRSCHFATADLVHTELSNVIGGSRVQQIPSFPTRARDDENLHTLLDVARHGGRAFTGLIVGMGVDGHEPQRWSHPGSLASVPRFRARRCPMPSGIPARNLSPAMRERYGIRPTPWWFYAGVGAVIAAFIAATGWVGYQLSAGAGLQYEVLSWRVVAPDRTDITFEVTRADNADVYCVIRAQDETRADVGYAIAVLPRGTTYVQETYSLRTLAPAFVIEVLACEVGGPPERVIPPQFPQGVVPPDQPWSEQS